MSSLLIPNTAFNQNELDNQQPLVNINNPEVDIPSNLCSCNVFYTSSLFNNLCSGCFANKYPEQYKQKCKNLCMEGIKPRYRLHELKQETKDYLLANNNGYWAGIKLILNSYKIVTNDQKKIAYDNILKLLHKIIIINRGLTSKQITLIYNKLKEPSNEDWRLQHLLCGFCIDPWNLTTEENGGVGFCYYGSIIPYKNEKLPLPPIIYHNKIQQKPSIFIKAYNRYNELTKCEQSQYETYKRWIENIPGNFKKNMSWSM